MQQLAGPCLKQPALIFPVSCLTRIPLHLSRLYLTDLPHENTFVYIQSYSRRHPKGDVQGFIHGAVQKRMRKRKIIIEPGNRFGKLTVIKPTGDNIWLCHCDCGMDKELSFRSLVYQNVRSCGCLRGRKETLVIQPGMRFGKLTVVKKGPRVNRNLVWICKCDCGNMKTIYQSNLQNGKTRSCGCNQYVRPKLFDQKKNESEANEQNQVELELNQAVAE